jgi:hypothetical protein
MKDWNRKPEFWFNFSLKSEKLLICLKKTGYPHHFDQGTITLCFFPAFAEPQIFNEHPHEPRPSFLNSACFAVRGLCQCGVGCAGPGG